MEHHKERYWERAFSGTGSHITCEWWKIKGSNKRGQRFSI